MTHLQMPWLDDESTVPDRKGRPVPVVWAAAAKYSSSGYDRVGDTRLGVDNVRGTRVSTVWLGPTYPFGFETMVFSDVPDLEDLQWRWPTLRSAEIGHRRVVRAVTLLLRRLVPLAKPHRPGHW